MDDEQLKDLIETTTPSDGDIIYTVVDPAVTPLDRKITWTTIKAFLKTYFDGLYEKLTNKVTSFQVTPDDTHYPSEKLVKDNLDLLSDESFYAGTMTVNAGTLNTGTVADLQAVGGTDVNIQEGSGANPLTVTFDFTGVTKLSAFVFFGYYLGGSGHQLDVEIYNHLTTNWDNLGLVGAETSKKWYSFPIYNTNSYINAGAVSVRIRHIQNGNITHQLILDYLELNYGGAGGSGSVSASSVSFVPSGDLSATNVASALAELDTEKVSKSGDSMSGALNEAKGSDIASASSIDIGAGTGNFIDITGTTTITALGTVQAGTERTLRFTGVLTLTHNGTSLILPTGANIVTQAGDVAKFRSLGSGNWVCVSYTRKDGSALAVSLSSPTQKSGIITRDITASSGTQVFAHGLGKIPTIVRISSVFIPIGDDIVSHCFGCFDSSGNHSVSSIVGSDSSDESISSSSVYGIDILTYPIALAQRGVISVDATNITITWTKNSTTTGVLVQILWEAIG